MAGGEDGKHSLDEQRIVAVVGVFVPLELGEGDGAFRGVLED